MRRAFIAVILQVLVAIAGGVLLPGCQPGEGTPFASETDEPHFRRGMQMLRAGRNQEALSAFLKVVEKRGGDAPESHLECGILYLQHIKDPIAAIYHFRKFLELRPNSPQAPRTRELIDTATKEFLRVIPAPPFEGQQKLLEMTDTVERLQKENYQLKEQIAQMRGLPAPSRPAPVASAGVEDGSTAVRTTGATETEDEPEAAPVIPVTPARGAAPTASTPAATEASRPAAAATGRVHVVQKGDNLYAISRRYYGNASRVRDIVAANPETLRDPNTPLKIGMQLRIP